MQANKLLLEPPRLAGDTIEIAATLQTPVGACRLWWRVPAQWQDALTHWADPFVVAFVFPMMEARAPVHVEGRVSPSLLENIEYYMALWSALAPKKYAPVRITADLETEAPPPADPTGWLLPFSGGVDSCFTAYRHHHQLAGRRSRRIAAALVMDRFDIWPDAPDPAGAYQSLLAGARAQLNSLRIPLIPISSNFQEIRKPLPDSFGTQLISGLHLFAPRFGGALIANSLPLANLHMPWGSNPVTDQYLGTAHFPIQDDGAECQRLDKVIALAQWPEGLRHLRVCFTAKPPAVNCCRCEKCIRNILALRIAGIPLPASFPQDVSDAQIRALRMPDNRTRNIWLRLLNQAQQHSMRDRSWARAIAAVVRREKRRRQLQTLKEPFIPLRSAIRTLFRGSSQSRRERAPKK